MGSKLKTTDILNLDVDEYAKFSKKDYDFLRNYVSKLNTTLKKKFFVKTLDKKVRVYRYK